MQPHGTDLSEPSAVARLGQTCSDICLLAAVLLGVAGETSGGLIYSHHNFSNEYA